MVRNKRVKIRQLLDKAKSELKWFERTNGFAHLSQACEKTWVAFTLLVEYKSKTEIRQSSFIKPIAHDLGYEKLFQQARFLHTVHYEGSPGITKEEIIDEISDTINQIEKLNN